MAPPPRHGRAYPRRGEQVGHPGRRPTVPDDPSTQQEPAGRQQHRTGQQPGSAKEAEHRPVIRHRPHRFCQRGLVCMGGDPGVHHHRRYGPVASSIQPPNAPFGPGNRPTVPPKCRRRETCRSTLCRQPSLLLRRGIRSCAISPIPLCFRSAANLADPQSSTGPDLPPCRSHGAACNWDRTAMRIANHSSVVQSIARTIARYFGLILFCQCAVIDTQGLFKVIARRLRRGNLVLAPEPAAERFPHSNEIAALRSQ